MALTAAQRLYCMYVIGTVESNCTWASVNYNDPITVGMMQWYGTRAAGLLNRMQTEDSAGYAMLAESLRNDLANNSSTSNYWNSRYLTRTEGNSFITAAERDENHAVQQNQFLDDLDGYTTTLASWGCATDTPDHIKSFIYACCMYHQSPAAAGRVIAGVGGTASIARLRDGALNDRTLSSYRNRYNTAYDLLDSWDGASNPPDFGQSGETDTDQGGDSGYIPQITSQIQSVMVYGESLVVRGESGSVLCYRQQGNLYLPQRNVAAPETPTTPGGGGGAVTPDTVTQMQDLWRNNQRKWAYSQGAGRLNPPSSGYSDCSGCIWWAVNAIDPGAADRMGSSTYEMLRGQGTVIASGGYGEYPSTDIVHVGDIIVMGWNSTDIMSATSRHVEWVFPDGQLWGAGEAPLPKPSGSIQQYMTQTTHPRSWRLIRVFS